MINLDKKLRNLDIYIYNIMIIHFDIDKDCELIAFNSLIFTFVLLPLSVLPSKAI